MKQGIYKVVSEWATRKLMLLQGDADYVTVNPTDYAEMDKESGLTVLRDQPSLTITALLITEDIATQDNPYAGSGKLDGNGVSADFFSDVNMRKGLLYAWDEQTYLKDGTAGHAVDPVVPIPIGMPYRDESIKRPAQNLQTAADYFKKAWGGKVWDLGFKMTLAYNTGNTGRQIAAQILADTLAKINPKFQIEVKGLEWPQYLQAYKGGQLPLFVSGWAPDYPDPDNYIGGAFITSYSAYAGLTGYKNDTIDQLTKEASLATDTAVRQKDYYQIQKIFMDEVPCIMVSQAIGNYYFKDWVHGMFYNQMQADMFDHLRYVTKGM
jgi:peptide/nickel transport system substrate-binding protein